MIIKSVFKRKIYGINEHIDKQNIYKDVFIGIVHGQKFDFDVKGN